MSVHKERLLEGSEHDLLIYWIQLRCLAIGMPAGRGIRQDPLVVEAEMKMDAWMEPQ